MILPLIMVMRQLLGGAATLTLLLMVVSVCHAVCSVGWRHAARYFALSTVISLIYEELGVVTGLIYGQYHYTDMFSAKIGLVTILISIA